MFFIIYKLSLIYKLYIMIKIINVELIQPYWIKKAENDTYWYECPALNNFISDGWKIKDWNISGRDCVFILEKFEKINKLK